MRQITIISSIFILLISVNSYSQETKRKTVQKERYVEEYDVLKEDKKVKHGQYVKFEKYILDRKIPIEFGFFDNGKRVGEWYFFYLNGDLKSYGNYHNGLKHGLWKEYYKPVNKEESLSAFLNGQSDVRIDENGSLTVEKNDKLISAIGVYESNKKLGSWNYYGNKSNLIHKYDHSLDKLLISSVSDSTNLKCPFLGGIDRFFEYYFEREEALDYKDYPLYLKVVLKIGTINEKLTIERISSIGDETAALELEQLIRSFPNDWIGSYIEKPIILTIERKLDSNKLLINATFNP